MGPSSQEFVWESNVVLKESGIPGKLAKTEKDILGTFDAGMLQCAVWRKPDAVGSISSGAESLGLARNYSRARTELCNSFGKTTTPDGIEE
jgi:hypothetical protein